MQVEYPRLETLRLILRPVTLADFDAWADFTADVEPMQFIGGAQPRAMAWRAMMTMAGASDLHGFAMFSVIENASGRWVGRVGPWIPEGWSEAKSVRRSCPSAGARVTAPKAPRRRSIGRSTTSVGLK